MRGHKFPILTYPTDDEVPLITCAIPTISFEKPLLLLFMYKNRFHTTEFTYISVKFIPLLHAMQSSQYLKKNL